MKTEQILTTDLLDIIFTNRNKAYGAYDLRKYYHQRLYLSLGITFLIITILFSISFLLESRSNVKPLIDTFPAIEFKNVKPSAETPKIPVPPKPPKTPKIQPATKSQLFVSNIKFVEQHATKLAVNLDSFDISNTTNLLPDAGKKIPEHAVDPGTNVTNKLLPEKTTDKSIPIETAEVAPVYPGGEEALIKFLQKHLNNPTDLEEGQVVTVKIKFIVGYNGVLKGFEVLEDGGKAFNNEVIRVLKKMPAWVPGKNGGEHVSVYYTIPVKFL